MILDTIVEAKKEEVRLLLSQGISRPDYPVDPPRGFQASLTDSPGVAIIAEVKKASPSKGVICRNFDPIRIASRYKKGGASAISVLTDEKFFQGSLSYLAAVRTQVDIPVLRKDFIIHELQIEQARQFGADAILLIAAILETGQIKDYLDMAHSMDMDVLVEVHDEYELEKALAAQSRLIGINNRNLQDFSVSLETTFRIAKQIPDAIPVVSESGIRNADDIRRLADAGICAALIGESLMRAGDQDKALRELVLSAGIK